MKWLSGTSLAAAVVAAALSAARAQDKMPETPYFPLQVGNTWHYKAGDVKFSQKVAKHETADNIPCARVETIVDGKPAAFEHVAVKEDGVYRVSLGGRRTEPPVRFLKLPPKSGETWAVESKVLGRTVKCTFKSGAEEVKVPAGTYLAVTAASTDLEVNGLKGSVTFYFAKDVGMVKEVIEMSGQKKVEIELEKFEPAK
jgi:hypothetical protein